MFWHIFYSRDAKHKWKTFLLKFKKYLRCSLNTKQCRYIWETKADEKSSLMCKMIKLWIYWYFWDLGINLNWCLNEKFLYCAVYLLVQKELCMWGEKQ